MKVQLKAIQDQLKSKSDSSNIAFFKKMVPGRQKIYGVKTPELNLLAKEYKSYGFDLVKALWQSGALEEKVIAIKILEQIGAKDPQQTIELVKQFSTQIDNWAVCDGLGMQALKGVRKKHAEEIFRLAEKYNRSKDPWQRRLSLVMVEWYTRDPLCHGQIKKLVKAVEEDDEYYVKKAVQWINRNFSKHK
jgi:3-methyladenine DNA glycosylase AlkD